MKTAIKGTTLHDKEIEIKQGLTSH